MNEQFRQLMEKHGAIGGAAAVVKDGAVVWAGGMGVRDKARNLPVDEHTMFRVASISKVVLGTALMQLWEQGKFQLDDDISDLLGFEVSNPHHPNVGITVRQLMTHTGSVYEEQTPAAEQAYTAFLRDSRTSSQPPAIRELLCPGGTYYTEELWAPWRAGEKFEYSNLGTGILATILERLSGERFDQYVQKYICAPLQMKASFNIHDLADINQLSVLYDEHHQPRVDDYGGVVPASVDLSTYAIGTNGMIFSPQGGLRASVLDLTKLLLAHQNGGELTVPSIKSGEQVSAQILHEETVDLMHREQWRGGGFNGLYKQKGLLVHITDDLIDSERLYGHAGDAYGVLTGMYFSKEHDFGFTYCINGAQVKPGHTFFTVEEELARLLYDTFISKK